MRLKLQIHVQGDGTVTSISYDVYNGEGELVRTWVGTPKAANSLPHAALSDLLRRLDSSATPLNLFP